MCLSACRAAAATSPQARTGRCGSSAARRASRSPPARASTSDAIDLGFVNESADPLLAGRKLVVSFHAVGSTGPMTWHAKALTTSYLTAPRAGSHGRDECDAAFRSRRLRGISSTRLMCCAGGTVVVACFGDSITDGTASTLNGDDRWPDVLSRRLHDSSVRVCRSSTPASAAIASRRRRTRPRRRWRAAVGPRSLRSRCCRSVGTLGGDLARGHQRSAPERRRRP